MTKIKSAALTIICSFALNAAADLGKPTKVADLAPAGSLRLLNECRYGHLRNEMNLRPNEAWSNSQKDDFIGKCLERKLKFGVATVGSIADKMRGMSGDQLLRVMRYCDNRAELHPNKLGWSDKTRAGFADLCIGDTVGRGLQLGSVESDPGEAGASGVREDAG